MGVRTLLITSRCYVQLFPERSNFKYLHNLTSVYIFVSRERLFRALCPRRALRPKSARANCYFSSGKNEMDQQGTLLLET